MQIGIHIGREDICEDKVSKAVDLGVTWFQYFIEDSTEGQRYSYSKFYETFGSVLKGKRQIVHAPFWYSLVKGKDFLRGVVRDCEEQLKAMHSYGVEYFVVHPGYFVAGREATEEEIANSRSVIRDALKELSFRFGRAGVGLLLENGAGARTKGMFAGVREIVEAADNYRGNVGLCFDTAHAFANGESDEDFSMGLEKARVVHLNPVPQKVKRGGHLDRHGNTILRESVGIDRGMLVEWAKKSKVPIVLESANDRYIEDLKELI